MPRESLTPLSSASVPVVSADALRVDGDAVVYRLFDVGYGISLDRVLALLATQAPERVRPVRGEAQALQIPNPPITVILGTEVVVLGGERLTIEVSARIFDFGVVSLRARVPAPPGITWQGFIDFGEVLDGATVIPTLLDSHLVSLTERIRSCIERPAIAEQSEEYIVYRVARLTDVQGSSVLPSVLHESLLSPLLLNDRRVLSADAMRELLPHRFSYTAEDLAILTWDNALIVDASLVDTDVQFILEFANAQLLELRFYDATLDAELPRMYDRIEATRPGTRGLALFSRRYAPLLAELQRTVADSTELVERVENALKVTDDVYLARIYAAALELFRGRTWRAGIDRKLTIIRETYSMLNDEQQSARSEALEVAIVLLIVLEILLAIFRH
ncbi:MAG TPA: hypothetical protein VE861_04880 [Gemmatimonadaceae bacterium]|nr:hypothetical protein [Gemmatimonadaceae bacterium]